MSLSILLIKNSFNDCIRHANPLMVSIRHGHKIRGKPTGVAKTIEERLKAENQMDPEVAARVNIGFPRLKVSRSSLFKERLDHRNAHRSNDQLEKSARCTNLLIDINQAQKEYINNNGQYDLRIIGDHYGIFKDLFDSAYFVPRVHLDIKYRIDANNYCQVHNGNIIKSAEATMEPEVSFNGTMDPITRKKMDIDCYWTLIATNPDCHFRQSDAECVHWFVGNIPNGDIKKGEVVQDYLRPLPPRGVGYQRFIFVLYKQNKKLDYSAYNVEKENTTILKQRTFNTLDFYKKHQDNLTPAGLSFCQTTWDKSLSYYYHDILNVKDPIYQYDFPAPYLADQKHFPLKKAFNLYMDRHRDIKLVNKEYLEGELDKTHPFKRDEQPLRYPNAHTIRDVPSWLKTEIKKRRLGIGRINDY